MPVPKPADRDPWRDALVQFGRTLRALREDANLTQQVLAGRIGSSNRTLSDLELGKGDRVPTDALVNAFLDGCLAEWQADEVKRDARRADLMRAYHLLGDLRDRFRGTRVNGETGEFTGGRQRISSALPANVLRFGVRPAVVESFQSRPVEHVLRQVLGEHRAAVLTGMGGVGKTQVANAYVETRWRDPALDVAAWVSADSSAEVIRTYAQMAVRLAGMEGRDERQAARDFVGWLQDTERSWLIVLDGLDDPTQLDGLWPPPASNGQVIVTSRDQGSAFWTGNRKRIPVGAFTPAESAAYLSDRLRDNPALLDGAAELPATLGRLPLAMAHAAQLMVSRGMTAATYQQWFASESKTLAQLAPMEHERPPGYNSTIAATWRISIARANELTDGVAPILLAMASLLGQTAIPTEIFHTGAALSHLTEALGRPVDIYDVTTALSTLSQLGLVGGNPAESKVFDVHLMVQRTVKELIGQQDFPRVVRIVATALNEYWESLDTSADLSVQRWLHSHADAVVTNAGGLLLDNEHGVHSLLVTMGNTMGWAGLPSEAAAYFRGLAVKAAKVLGARHLDTLKCRSHRAKWRGHSGDSHGARAEFDALFVDYQQFYGDDHLDTLDARASRASYHGRTNGPVSPIAELETVVAERQRLLDSPFHPLVLRTRARLAFWKARVGDIDRAIDALTDVLRDFLAYQPAEIADILRTRASLAEWLGERDGPQAAVAGYKELLADQLRSIGPDHPDTINTRRMLLHWLKKAGDRQGTKDEQRQLRDDLKRILKQHETLYGSTHPDMLARRAELTAVRVRAKRKNLPTVIAELRVLIAIADRESGPDQHITRSLRYQLATALGRNGEPDKAIAELRDLLVVTEHTFDSDHPETFKILLKLASLQDMSGDHLGAISTLRNLLRRQEKVLSADHRHVYTTLKNLTSALESSLDDEETRNRLHFGEALRVLLDYQERNDFVSAGEVLDTRTRLAVWRGGMGHRHAVAELQEIVRECARVLEADDPVGLRARFLRARQLRLSGDSGDAEHQLSILLADACELVGERDPFTINVHKEWKACRTRPRQSAKSAAPSEARPRRHPIQESDADLGAKSRADNTIPNPVDENDLDQLLGEKTSPLLQSSRAAGPLLEALALSFERGVPRRNCVWATMANALSAVVIVDDSDIEALLEVAGPYIRPDVDDGMMVYRLANSSLIQKVLANAARRTGLAAEVDTRHRQRCVSTALTRHFVSNRYVLRNLPRHAAAAGNLRELAKNPFVLDRVDIEVLVEEILRSEFGATPLPNELSGVLQARHQLTGQLPDERAVLRALASAEGRVLKRKLSNGLPPAWTPVWVNASRDPRHLTFTGTRTKSKGRRQPNEIIALSSAVVPGGELVLVVGYEPGKIEFWDALTARKIDADITAEGKLVAADIVTTDGNVLLAVVSTLGIRMWDIASRAPHTDIWHSHSEILAGTTAQLPDEQQVLVVLDAQGHLVVLDPLSLEVLDRSEAVLDEPGRGITEFPARWTTGDSVATLDNGAVRFWEIRPLRLTDTVVRLQDSSVTDIAAVQVNGTTRLWVGANNGKVSIWNPYTGENVVPSTPDPHSGPVYAVAAVPDTPDRTFVASGGAGGAIILRDSTSGKKAAATLTGHTAQVRALTAVRLDEVRTVLVSAGRDSSVRMWDLSDALALDVNVRTRRSLGTAMTTARVGPETRLIVGCEDGFLRQYDISTGDEMTGTQIHAHSSKVGMMARLATHDGNSVVATVGGKTLRLWNLASPKPLAEHLVPAGKEILAMTLAQIGRKTVVAVGFSTGEIVLWYPSTDQSKLIEAHDTKIASIAPITVDDHTYVVSADKNGMIRFWDPHSGDPEGPDILTGFVPSDAMCVMDSRYGPTLVVGGAAKQTGRVRRYSLANREMLPGFSIARNSFIKTLHCLINANGHQVLVGIGRAFIVIWPPAEGREMHRLELDGEIEASCAIDSLLVLSTRRGLYALKLTHGG